MTDIVGVGPAKFGSGAQWIDVDSDGDLDLFVTTMGDTRHYLYINYVSIISQSTPSKNDPSFYFHIKLILALVFSVELNDLR